MQVYSTSENIFIDNTFYKLYCVEQIITFHIHISEVIT